jgi:23S rRNA (adenine1618-N6)-methyltransferase
MHPRNRHKGRYDFAQLTVSCPELSRFVIKTPGGESSIDFANPEAVQMLNRALLKSFYGISHWEIPPGYLSPPIPSRADYVHRVAELLRSKGGSYPTGALVRVLDVGVGANCIYPIIGHAEYGWTFVGSDVDPVAVESAKKIVDSNPSLKGAVELRLQASPEKMLTGIVRPDETFDAVMCNPPFHASLEEAEAGSRRKWKNLGHGDTAKKNFGGQGRELWFPGGEAAFVRRMVEESAALRTNVRWFTALVSKEESLGPIESAMKKAAVADRRTMAMEQGQKKSRIVAWTFQ